MVPAMPMQQLYSLLDRKIREFGPVLGERNEETLTRMLRDAVVVEDAQTMLQKYPEDFDLYYLGEYDNELGMIHPTTPRLVYNVGEQFVYGTQRKEAD
jgi:hypothetical protein